MPGQAWPPSGPFSSQESATSPLALARTRDRCPPGFLPSRVFPLDSTLGFGQARLPDRPSSEQARVRNRHPSKRARLRPIHLRTPPLAPASRTGLRRPLASRSRRRSCRDPPPLRASPLQPRIAAFPRLRRPFLPAPLPGSKRTLCQNSCAVQKRQPRLGGFGGLTAYPAEAELGSQTA